MHCTCRFVVVTMLAVLFVSLPAFGQGGVEVGVWSGYGYPVDSVVEIATNTYVDGLAYFKKGKPSVIAASGENRSYFIFVYDRKGKMVAGDSRDGTTYRIAAWTPKYTGPFLVRVVAFHGHPDPLWVAVWSNHRGH